MHSNETWKRYELPESVKRPFDFSVDSIESGLGGNLIVKMTNYITTQTITILFEGNIHSYSETDESYKLELLYYLSDNHPELRGDGYPMFEVTNSFFFKSLSESSCETFNANNSTLFTIIDPERFIEIATDLEPTITVTEYCSSRVYRRFGTIDTIKKDFEKIPAHSTKSANLPNVTLTNDRIIQAKYISQDEIAVIRNINKNKLPILEILNTKTGIRKKIIYVNH